jgi:hypothetical protein
MKGIALGVDVINFIVVFAVNDKKDVREREGRVRVIGAGERIKLGA